MKKLYTLFLLIAMLPVFGQTGSTEPDRSVQQQFFVGSGEGCIVLYNLPEGGVNYQLVTLTGKVINEKFIAASRAPSTISVEGIHTGYYLVNVKNNKGFQSVKKAYIR